MATAAAHHDSDSDDKHGAEHVEKGAASVGKEAEFVDPAFDRKVVRKVDVRLLIILGAMYSIALIDRTNLSIVRLTGAAVDLQLTVGERYSIISCLFFVPYIIFELPSNIVLRRVGARNILSSICILWGGVMIGMGFVKTWTQLAGLRVILGFLESGFFPGCVFLIQCWYTRFQTQKRLALFYLFSMVTSAFGNVLGYAFSLLNGTHGIAGWRWIFIIEGAFTVALGIIAAFLIVDFPDKNTFLTQRETQSVITRVNADRGDAVADTLTWAKAARHVVDWKVWSYGLLFMGSTMPSYAFAYFLPVILAGAGYSTVLSLCMSAPPYAVAAIYTFVVAYYSDKTHHRGGFICLNSLVCIIGLMIVGYANNRGARYFGSFFAIMGAQCNVPSVLAYAANNVTSHSKRSVSSAVVIGMGGVGGIFASTVYREMDYPGYRPGLWATFGCQVLIITLVGILTMAFKSQNKAADEGKAEIENTPGFRYTI